MEVVSQGRLDEHKINNFCSKLKSGAEVRSKLRFINKINNSCSKLKSGAEVRSKLRFIND